MRTSIILSFASVLIVFCPLAAGAGSSSAIRIACSYVGKNAGEQILAAQADLLANGVKAGIIDASCFSGLQSIQTPIQLGSNWDNSFTLLLGPATFVLSARITVGRNSAIKGTPTGSHRWSTSNDSPRATVIRAASRANLFPAMILVGGTSVGDGTSAVIEDVNIDGNYPQQGTATWGNGVFIDRAAAVDLNRVSVTRCGGHGISISSSKDSDGKSSQESSVAKFSKVLAAVNNGCGLAITSTNDVFVTQSEFEDNKGDGVCVSNSGALRITNSDFGGNQGFGLNAFENSGALIITGNQFGNNSKNDLVISGGWGLNVISANQFIGSGRRLSSNVYSAIIMNSTTNTTITGNAIHIDQLLSGLELVGGSHCVTGNTFIGKRGSHGAIYLGAGATMSNGNLDNTTP